MPPDLEDSATRNSRGHDAARPRTLRTQRSRPAKRCAVACRRSPSASKVVLENVGVPSALGRRDPAPNRGRRTPRQRPRSSLRRVPVIATNRRSIIAAIDGQRHRKCLRASSQTEVGWRLSHRACRKSARGCRQVEVVDRECSTHDWCDSARRTLSIVVRRTAIVEWIEQVLRGSPKIRPGRNHRGLNRRHRTGRASGTSEIMRRRTDSEGGVANSRRLCPADPSTVNARPYSRGCGDFDANLSVFAGQICTLL